MTAGLDLQATANGQQPVQQLTTSLAPSFPSIFIAFHRTPFPVPLPSIKCMLNFCLMSTTPRDRPDGLGFGNFAYQFMVGEPLGVVVEVPLERLALQPAAQGLPLRDVAVVAQSLRLRFVVLSQPEIKDDTNMSGSNVGQL